MKDIYVKYATPPSSGDLKSFVNCKNATLHVPSECKESYVNNPDWNIFNAIVEDDLTYTFFRPFGNVNLFRDNDDNDSKHIKCRRE